MSPPKALLLLCAFALSLTMTLASSAIEILSVTAEQREALGIVVDKAQPKNLVPRPRLPGRITLPNSRVRLVTVRASAVLVSPLVAVGDSVTTG
ncbi:MAG: hypothetical protein ABGX04_04200, partial [Myxococcales bacterium]